MKMHATNLQHLIITVATKKTVLHKQTDSSADDYNYHSLSSRQRPSRNITQTRASKRTPGDTEILFYYEGGLLDSSTATESFTVWYRMFFICKHTM